MNTMTENQNEIKELINSTLGAQPTTREFWNLDKDNLEDFINEYHEEDNRSIFENIEEIISEINLLITEHNELAKNEDKETAHGYEQSITDYLQMTELVEQGMPERIAYNLTR